MISNFPWTRHYVSLDYMQFLQACVVARIKLQPLSVYTFSFLSTLKTFQTCVYVEIVVFSMFYKSYAVECSELARFRRRARNWCREVAAIHFVYLFIKLMHSDWFVKFSETPLVLYIFTKDRGVQELIINQTRSGSVAVNETIMQFSGESGY